MSWPSGLRIFEVRVRNFRSLKAVNVELDDYTILMGANNSGKSSFIHALHAAIGAGQRIISKEDVFIKRDETEAPKSRQVVIDILIRPVDADTGQPVEKFEADSPWLMLWGSGVMVDDEGNDIVAIRTTMKWNRSKEEYQTERRFLKDWQVDPNDWELSEPAEKLPNLTALQTEPLGLYLLDAQRDILDDLKSRSSLWSRMVAEHGLSEDEVEGIEEELSKINRHIVDKSEVLSHVEGHMGKFHDLLSCTKDGVAVAPLTRHIRDLSKGMDIILSTMNSSSFPLQRQSMGTRSLGTVLTFWAYMTWRQKRFGESAVHPMLAFEEPESHLHPQAQKALYRQVASEMPGQRIVSTHSPYIAGQASSLKIRHFLKKGDETKVAQLKVGEGTPHLTEADVDKLDKKIMSTRGDLLFSRLLVLAEGETEENALPQLAKKHLGRDPDLLGISIVGVGGYGGYKPFLLFAERLGIPWLVLSDGEPEALNKLDSVLGDYGKPLSADNDDVIVLPSGLNFEQYISQTIQTDVLVDILTSHLASSPSEKTHLESVWKSKSESDLKESLAKQFQKSKVVFGNLLGRELSERGLVPAEIQSLLDRALSTIEI